MRAGRVAKRVFVVALTAIVGAAVASPAHGKLLVRDGRDVAGPVDILRLTSGQSGPLLRIGIITIGGAPIAELSRQPRLDEPGETPYLCLRLDDRLVCVAATRDGDSAAFVGRISDAGTVGRLKRVPELRVRRPASNRIQIRGTLGAFALRPGKARVAGLSDWTGASCQAPPQPPPEPAPGEPPPPPPPPPPADLCRDRAPDDGAGRMRVVRPRLVGCTRNERRLIAHGPEGKRRIALTFDDGPGPYTSQILRILRERDVHATFFVVGQALGAYPNLARRELRAGHELGNHSWAHRTYPSAGDLRATSAQIRRATGFTPCTFRPPYGALSRATMSSAWSLGMSSVLWDVDPRDWELPGSGAIEDRVVANARSGSIVLLHDAGGPRGQTVAALPGIISRLRDRGFEFVTVSRLLGERPIWKP